MQARMRPHMRLFTLSSFLVALMVAMPACAGGRLPPGIWTNAEDAYFAETEGREKPPQIAIEIDRDGNWRRIDFFGQPIGEWSREPLPGLARRESGSGWEISGSEIRKARPFTCWLSVRKFAGKADGSEDWTFSRGLRLFDQGGRIHVPGNGEAPNVTIRLRNVTWEAGSRNRPSLVLYVHKSDPVRAEGYSWTSPEAALIGINLRWVQSSCSPEKEEAE